MTIAERTAFQRAFWDRFLESVERPHLFKRGNESARWRYLPRVDLIVSHYITGHSVGVFVRGRYGVKMPAVVERLWPHRAALEAGLEVPLGNPRFPYVRHMQTQTRDMANWDRMIAWLHEASELYECVLNRVVDPK